MVYGLAGFALIPYCNGPWPGGSEPSPVSNFLIVNVPNALDRLGRAQA
jgi:hypothetical protein